MDEYLDRIDNYLAPPSVSLGVTSGGYMRMRWNWPGRPAFLLDRVELHRGPPQGLSTKVTFSLASSGSPSSTIIPKGPNYYIAYVQQDVPTGEETVLATQGPFTWSTPTVRMSRTTLGFVKLRWQTPTPGAFEFVALWDRNPRTAGAGNYLIGTRHAATDPDREWVSARRWTPGLWIGYVERESPTQNGRVVAVSGPIR